MALSYLQSATNTEDLAEYTFSSQNFGTASADRYIIATIISRKAGAATTITGVTIGGVAATEVVQKTQTGTNTGIAGIFIAAVPSGASGDVVVTFGGTMVRCAIALYAATELASATAYDTDSSGGTASDPSVTLDIPDNGFAIAAAGTAASTSCVWVGLTEDYDSSVETFLTYSGASDEFETGEVGRTITANFASPSGETAGVFASWQYETGPGDPSFGNLRPMVKVGNGMSRNERAT